MNLPKNKKRLVYYLLIIVSVALVLAGLFMTEGQVFSTPVSEMRTFESPSPGIPAITANITYVFSASGSLSAQNPITVTVTVSDVNTSNLLQYYQAVGFLGSMANWETPATTENGTTQTTPNIPQQQNVTYGIASLQEMPDGTYKGMDMLIYGSEFDVQTFLIPQSWYPWQLNATPTGQQPILHVSGVATTLTWQYNEEATRLVLVSVGFAVLISQQAMDAVLRRRNAKKENRPI